MSSLSQRERRLVAVAVLFTLIALMWLGFVRPVLAGFEARTAQREELVNRYERNERLRFQLRPWAAQARRQRQSAPLYAVAAPTAPLAAEALQDRVGRALRDAGATVNAVRDEAPGGSGLVRVRADATVTVAQLTEAIVRLQTQPPLVVIESVGVTADQAFTSGRLSPMDVRLEVSAAWSPVRG